MYNFFPFYFLNFSHSHLLIMTIFKYPSVIILYVHVDMKIKKKINCKDLKKRISVMSFENENLFSDHNYSIFFIHCTCTLAKNNSCYT